MNIDHVYKTLLASILSFATLSHGEIVASDDFNAYTNGTIVGQNPANTPFTGAWTGTNLLDDTVKRTVDVVSGAVVVTDTSNFGTQFYAERSISVTGTAATDTYLGFDFTVGDSIPLGAYVAMRFGNKGFIGAGINMATGKLAVYGDPGGYVDTSFDAVANTTYRLVVKVSDNSLNDPLSLFVNPGSATEGIADVSTTGNWYVTGNPSFTLNALRIRKDTDDATNNGDDGSYTLDNLVISDDFASAVAIPEPGTLALVGIALASLLVFRRRR